MPAHSSTSYVGILERLTIAMCRRRLTELAVLALLLVLGACSYFVAAEMGISTDKQNSGRVINEVEAILKEMNFEKDEPYFRAGESESRRRERVGSNVAYSKGVTIVGISFEEGAERVRVRVLELMSKRFSLESEQEYCEISKRLQVKFAGGMSSPAMKDSRGQPLSCGRSSAEGKPAPGRFATTLSRGAGKG